MMVIITVMMAKMLDYKTLNFACGIEIHKQLESHKLFCNCPTIIDNKPVDLTIKRKIRAVAGIEGKKDIAALHEEQKDKTFIYEYSDRFACLVDIDCEPPFVLNKKALDIALEICLLLKAKIESKIIVMRKIIVDGSNPSSYQRLCLIARNGKIKTSKGIVRIPTIYLEEDSARRIKDKGNEIIFRVDRLGFPLVEISTSPDIKDPEHAKETAEILGMILKSTEKTKSGIGTIRQDINLSIKNGARIELKGFQNLKEMPKIIENEIKRQQLLIKNGEMVKEEVRRVNADGTTTFLRPLPGKLRFYPDTDQPEYKISKELIKKIKIPELIEEKALKLEKQFSLQPEIAKEIIKNKISLESLAKQYPRMSPKFIAQIIVEMPKELKARFDIKHNFTLNEFEIIFGLTNQHALQKEAVSDIMIKVAKKQKINLTDYKQLSFKEVEQEIKKIFQSNPALTPNAVMGIIMKKYSRKINPKEVFDLIKKLQ